MGFFSNSSGSKLTNTAATTAEQAAAIPVVTDTVEEDVSGAYAQKNARRNGIKATLLSSGRRSIYAVDTPTGNTTLG